MSGEAVYDVEVSPPQSQTEIHPVSPSGSYSSSPSRLPNGSQAGASTANTVSTIPEDVTNAGRSITDARDSNGSLEIHIQLTRAQRFQNFLEVNPLSEYKVLCIYWRKEEVLSIKIYERNLMRYIVCSHIRPMTFSSVLTWAWIGWCGFVVELSASNIYAWNLPILTLLTISSTIWCQTNCEV